jgi:predicted RNase H-like nuclease (RuvC/YqgF family)
MTDFPWAAIVSGLIAASVGVLTSLWARKSQSETNNLTGTNQEVERYNKFANELQEERTLYKEDVAKLRTEFEAFKKSVHSQFSQYRAYIHKLRGQVHDLGGTPFEWPKDLDQ